MRRVALAVLLVLWCSVAAEPADFFALDNCTGRERFTVEQQADLLAKFSFDGMGYTSTRDVRKALEALDSRGLRMHALYTVANINREGYSYDPGLKDALRALKDRPTVVMLGINGKAPEGDDIALRLVREVAGMAAESGLKVALYPHYGFHIATVEDALRVADKAGSASVGIAFNLCHWLRESGGKEPVEIAIKRLRRLSVVTINGADYEGGWERLIQTLDRGEFDVYRLLKALRERNYDGPIGLQCYNVPGEPEENLARSMAAWRRFWGRLAAQGK